MHHAASIVAVGFLGDRGQVMVIAFVVKYDDSDVAVNAWLAGARVVDVVFTGTLLLWLSVMFPLRFLIVGSFPAACAAIHDLLS